MIKKINPVQFYYDQQIEKQQSQIDSSNDKVEKLNHQLGELKKLVEQLLKK